jgi:hypothetical protein
LMGSQTESIAHLLRLYATFNAKTASFALLVSKYKRYIDERR